MHLKISSAKWRPFCPGEDDFNTLKLEQNGCYFGDYFYKSSFLTEKCLNFIPIWLSLRVQLFSISSGNGLTNIRWQAITWSNDDPVKWCHMASLGDKELTYLMLCCCYNKPLSENTFPPLITGKQAVTFTRSLFDANQFMVLGIKCLLA